MPELQSVRLIAEPDDYPPFDHLGEYSGDPGPEDLTIDRQERGDRGRGEHRYFISATPEYAEENYERMERFARGELASYGLKAVATVAAAGTTQRLSTPGLWGIASDTEAAHAEDIASEQLHILREVLDSLGIDHPTPLDAEWGSDAPWSGTVTE